MNIMKELIHIIDYIEDHIKEDISSEKLASMIGYSNKHFNRFFFMLTGSTVNAYLRKRRLTLAANDIIHTDKKIIDIAYDYGYQTHESFTKAFKNFHHTSPSNVRQGNVSLQSFSKLNLMIQIKGVKNMEYKIVKQETARFIGFVTTISTEDGKNFVDIPTFWNETMKSEKYQYLLKILEDKEYNGLGLVGLMYDFDNEKGLFQYMIAVQSDQPIIEGMIEKVIEEDTYASFTCRGPLPKSIQDTLYEIYTDWFPSSNYEHSGNCEMEIYPHGECVDEAYVCYYNISVKSK